MESKSVNVRTVPSVVVLTTSFSRSNSILIISLIPSASILLMPNEIADEFETALSKVILGADFASVVICSV